jgi:hypothetical protein
MKFNRGQLILLVGAIFLVTNGICFYIIDKKFEFRLMFALYFTCYCVYWYILYNI